MGVEVPSKPINRKEQYLAKIAGQAVEIPAEPLTREEAYLDYIAKHGSGGGGTNDYDDLLNQPKINNTTLKGNKSAEDLGLANASDVKKEFGGTLDQWNALTTEEKKEYDAYDITDDYSDGNYIYLPTIYSEEEREVGVWKDGKPLYQKTIDFGALPNNTSKTVTSGLTGVSVKSIFGTALASNGFTLTLPHTELSGAGSIDVSYLADNNVRISTDYNYSGYNSCVTLQYTKDSDAAGSGTWTPTGQYAEHYSTDEQIIGTWVDGKTLYQKVIAFETSKIIARGSWTNTTIDFTAETFVMAQGIAPDGAAFAINSCIDNGKLNLMVNAYTDITLNKIVLKYTKPTV